MLLIFRKFRDRKQNHPNYLTLITLTLKLIIMMLKFLM